jgi:hypothetical protein
MKGGSAGGRDAGTIYRLASATGRQLGLALPGALLAIHVPAWPRLRLLVGDNSDARLNCDGFATSRE